MSSKRTREGLCKLTGRTGRFVKAHLIPKALTKLEEPGRPLIQGGRGLPPRRRWSSWYDPALVIRDGENILEVYDTWAINELRKHHLVWSGWGPALRLISDHKEVAGTDWGIRKLTGLDPVKLRLFILSLLWRAAASNLPEFAEVDLPEGDLERLRQMLIQGDTLPLHFYPASLIQLSTIGEIHNQSPIAQIKIVPSFDNMLEQKIPIFRFYFGGLIIHIIRQAEDTYESEKMGSVIAGNVDELTICTVKYDSSFEQENLENVRTASYQEVMQLFLQTKNPAVLKGIF